jgi:hypothetical protein
MRHSANALLESKGDSRTPVGTSSTGGSSGAGSSKASGCGVGLSESESFVVGLVGLANPDPETAAVGAFMTNIPDSAFFFGSLTLVIFLYTVSMR